MSIHTFTEIVIMVSDVTPMDWDNTYDLFEGLRRVQRKYRRGEMSRAIAVHTMAAMCVDAIAAYMYNADDVYGALVRALPYTGIRVDEIETAAYDLAVSMF